MHGAVESRTFIHSDARAEDVSIDLRPFSQPHINVTMDVSIDPPLDRYGTGVYEGGDSSLFAHGEILLMMSDSAFDRALNQYLFVRRKFSSKYQR